MAVTDPIGLLDIVAPINQASRAHPIAFRLRSAQDMGFERSLLPGSKLFPVSRRRAVLQTVRTFGIEAPDSIVRGLTFHPGQLSGFRPEHPLKRIGKSQQP